MKEGCFDIAFPLPHDRSTWTAGQRWFYARHNEWENDSFMASYQDWVVCGDAWLFTTETAKPQKYRGAALRFGQHGGVMMGPLCLVAPFPHFKNEYDDWDKNSMEHARACENSIQGQVGGMACVFVVYPFQLERLKRLAKLELVKKLQRLIGSHCRLCLSLQ